jgi:hyperosmotically inducible protein
MTSQPVVFVLIAAALHAAACDPMKLGSGGGDESNAKPAADNTAVNDRDRDGDAKTPLDQGQTQADIDVSASIRRSLLAQADLSVNAHNVKVITADGAVTLRGVVNSEAEKVRIAQVTVQTQGVKHVDNQLTVSPPAP